MTNLWVPGMDKKKVGYCRICKTPFFEGEESRQVRHVKKCVEDYGEQLQANSPRKRLPFVYDRDWGDPEADAHYRRWLRGS